MVTCQKNMYNKMSSCCAVRNRSVRDGLNVQNIVPPYKQFHYISLADTPCVTMPSWKEKKNFNAKKNSAMLWWLKTQPCSLYLNIRRMKTKKKFPQKEELPAYWKLKGHSFVQSRYSLYFIKGKSPGRICTSFLPQAELFPYISGRYGIDNKVGK